MTPREAALEAIEDLILDLRDVEETFSEFMDAGEEIGQLDTDTEMEERRMEPPDTVDRILNDAFTTLCVANETIQECLKRLQALPE